MRFPNAFRGVKKIWLAEMLMLLAVILGIVLVFVIAGNCTIDGDDVEITGAETPIAILTIGAALVALIAFVLNLVGLINARKDDSGFRIALLVTVLGIIASAISSIWDNDNKNLAKWMEIAITICSMWASYYVLTGIANLAEQYPDPKTKELALKSRTLVEGSFCATAIVKFIINIFNIKDGSTIYTILAIVAALLELASYVLYLRALSKGKKMLAK